MLFGHKNRFQIDLAELPNEKDRLTNYLQTKHNLSATPDRDKLVVDSEKLSALELEKAVSEYVHRHNLSRAYYVSVESKTVKINRFKGSKKKEHGKKGSSSQSITQSWGL
jgi:hypothetical protein